MTVRVLRPVITLTTVLAILVAAVAVYAFSTGMTASATGMDSGTYRPQTRVKLCNDMGTFAPDTAFNGGNGTCNETSGLAAGAHPDVTTVLDMVKGDYNFSNVVTLGPNQQTIAAGCVSNAGCPAGTTPAGERIGALHSVTTLGTFNNACLLTIGIDFLLYSVALPNGGAAPRSTADPGGFPGSSSNIAFPLAEGTSNRFGEWKVGTSPGSIPFVQGSGTPLTTQAAASEGTSAADAASVTLSIQNYPSYLLDAFDPDFEPGTGDNYNGGTNSQPLVPLAAYGGLHFVVSDWIPLYFLQFSSGALTAMVDSPLKGIVSEMGQPSVSVLQDPTAVSASPTDITDFCTLLQVTTVLKGVSLDTSVNRITNPAAGTTAFFVQYNASIRDTDQDSYENALDSCPIDVNQGDPRLANGASNGDVDADGIDNACDGDPGSFGITDADGDIFKNRVDNCPQLTNGLVTPTPVPTNTAPPHAPYQKEDELQNIPADKGPRSDTMGNVCDSGSKAVRQNGQIVTITLDPAESNGRYMVATNIVPKCIGTVGANDVDADGYCTAQDSFVTGSHATARHLAWAGATHPAIAALSMDTDGDGVNDIRETWMSNCSTGGALVVDTSTPPPVPFATCIAPATVVATGSPGVTYAAYPGGADSVHSCAQTLGNPLKDDEGPQDNWGMDYNDDGTVNGNDLLKFAAPFGHFVDQGTVSVAGSGPGPGTVAIYRFDIDNDGAVNGNDLLKFAPVFSKTCASSVPVIPAFTQQ